MHFKYEVSISFGLKVMTNVKDFAKKLLRESLIVLSGQKLGVCEYLPRT